MIKRRRSYSEAIESDAVPVRSLQTVARAQSMNTVIIPSSSDDEESRTDKEERVPNHKDAFHRSESVRCYATTNDDVTSSPSVVEIYNNCLKYVSEENLRRSRRLSEFSELCKMLHNEHQRYSEAATQECDLIELKIVEEPDILGNVDEVVVYETTEANENLDGIEIDEEFYRDNPIVDNSTSFPMTYTGRNSTRKHRKKPEYFGSRAKRPKRVVFKSGDTNIPLRNNIAGRAKMFMDDIATTMIEWRWRWLILGFSACNFIVWLAFALLFYVAAYANGDLADDYEGTRCIEAGKTFTGIFTFSVESQVSIGYGEKYPNEECPEVIFILLMEVVVGYIMIGVTVCIVYAKIIRPEKHLEGVGFSKNAVVCMRDGKLCLVFQVWDCLEKHSISTQTKGYFVKHTVGSSPLVYPINFGSSPLLLWPMTVQHVIDETSPLYDMSAKDLLDKRFEVVVTLTGAARSTGQMSQSRTSYMPHEILWGSRFKMAVSYSQQDHAYVIDAKCLNKVESVDIPLCSARLLKQVNNVLQDTPKSLSSPGSPSIISPLGSPYSSPNWSFRSKLFNKD